MDSKRIGRVCQKARLKNSQTLKDVASETYYSVENISAFEHGRVRNSQILIYYIIKYGLGYKDFMEEENGHG